DAAQRRRRRAGDRPEQQAGGQRNGGGGGQEALDHRTSIMGMSPAALRETPSYASWSCLRANSRKRGRASSSGPSCSSSAYFGSAATSSATLRTSAASASWCFGSRSRASTHVSEPS